MIWFSVHNCGSCTKPSPVVRKGQTLLHLIFIGQVNLLIIFSVYAIGEQGEQIYSVREPVKWRIPIRLFMWTANCIHIEPYCHAHTFRYQFFWQMISFDWHPNSLCAILRDKKMFICIFTGFKIRTNKPSTDSDSAQNFASFGAWFGFQYITVDPVPSRVRLLEKAKLYYTLFLLAKLTY